MAVGDGDPEALPAGVALEPAMDLPAGRDAAVSALFDAYYSRLVALARRILSEPAAAEDVTMDAFVGLYRRWDRVRRPDDAFFYLRSSVVNGSRTRIRREVMARGRQATLWGSTAPLPDDHDGVAERDEVLRALRRLSGRQRQVLVLRFYEQLSEAEIAETLGCSNGSVKTHAARGLRALAEMIGEPR